MVHSALVPERCRPSGPRCWQIRTHHAGSSRRASLAPSATANTVQNIAVSAFNYYYGNSTLAGLPGNQFDSLQSVMNAVARLVCSARKYEHKNPLLRDLYWLRVSERIEFKLSVLVFRCLHGTALPYLASKLRLVADVDTRKRLRSSSTSALVTPSSCRTTIGDRMFFVAAPHA